jgi:DNA-directed RNA polymerase specialized sigma24 family protein
MFPNEIAFLALGNEPLLVKLRYFAGMTMREAAGVLEVSVRTAERYWRYTRAWLAEYMQKRSDDS